MHAAFPPPTIWTLSIKTRCHLEAMLLSVAGRRDLRWRETGASILIVPPSLADPSLVVNAWKDAASSSVHRFFPAISSPSASNSDLTSLARLRPHVLTDFRAHLTLPLAFKGGSISAVLTLLLSEMGWRSSAGVVGLGDPAGDVILYSKRSLLLLSRGGREERCKFFRLLAHVPLFKSPTMTLK